MGLSNQERFSKIVWSIRELQNHVLDDRVTHTEQFKKNYPRLVKLIKRLWPDFLGRTSNGLRWIMGDELQNESMSGNSLISVAFESQAPTTAKTLADLGPQDGFYKDLGDIRDMMDMRTLINDGPKGSVVYAYHACEQIAYALHRYDDEFSQSLKLLNTTLRNMQGEIFDIFSRDEDFLRSYLIARICDKCVPYDENDIVSRWVVKQNVHHDLRLHRDMTKELLFHTWRKIQFRYVYSKNLLENPRITDVEKANALKAQERMEILLKLSGRRNHYEHQHRELVEMVEKHNADHPDDKIDVTALKGHFTESIQAHAKYENDSSYHRDCSLTGNYESHMTDTIQNFTWENYDKVQSIIEKAKGDFSKLTAAERRTLYYNTDDFGGDAPEALTKEQRAELLQMIDRDKGEVAPALRGPGYEDDRKVPSGLKKPNKKKTKKAKK